MLQRANCRAVNCRAVPGIGKHTVTVRSTGAIKNVPGRRCSKDWGAPHRVTSQRQWTSQLVLLSCRSHNNDDNSGEDSVSDTCASFGVSSSGDTALHEAPVASEDWRMHELPGTSETSSGSHSSHSDSSKNSSPEQAGLFVNSRSTFETLEESADYAAVGSVQDLEDTELAGLNFSPEEQEMISSALETEEEQQGAGSCDIASELLEEQDFDSKVDADDAESSDVEELMEPLDRTGLTELLEAGIPYSPTLIIDETAENYDPDERGEATSLQGSTEAREMAVALAGVAVDTKGKDVVVLHVAPLIYWTSYMVIVTVASRPQLNAILDKMAKHAKEVFDATPPANPGRSKWEVLDFGEVVVHVMNAQERDYYDLESFYGTAEEVELPFSQDTDAELEWSRSLS